MAMDSKIDFLRDAEKKVMPELKGLLVPMCEYNHACYEIKSCGRYEEERMKCLNQKI